MCLIVSINIKQLHTVYSRFVAIDNHIHKPAYKTSKPKKNNEKKLNYFVHQIALKKKFVFLEIS